MINLKTNELPDCKCGKGKLLPVEDVSQQGTAYLKGWFCPACSTYWVFKSGVILVGSINPNLSER